MKQLIKNFKLLSILIFALSFNGCDDDEAVLPEVLAGFTYTINQDIGTVNFINISENANTYEWDFGDGTTSKQINPVKTYSTGEYTVVLKAKNVAGATGVFEDKVYINIPVPVRLPINFDGQNVKYNTVTTFNGVVFNVVDNPDVSGSNAVASKVGAITNSGAAWEGFFYDLDAPINLSTNKTIKLNFWSDKVLNVLVKLEEGTAAATELSVAHGGTGWEEMIFTFDSGASYNRFTVFVDGPGTTAGTFYIDDIEQVPTIDITAPVITLNGNAMISINLGDTFTDPGATAVDNIDGDISSNIVVSGDVVDINTPGTYIITYNVSDAAGNAALEVTRTVEVLVPSTKPTTSAPVPPARDASNVISVYGETYTNIGIASYNPNWGQSGFNSVNTAFDPGDGNLILAYPNFNYQGTDFSAPQNASTMEFLHVDIWVSSSTTNRMVKVSPINSGSGAGEFLVEVPLTPGAWNSVDLPKTAFTGMTWDAVSQMKFDGQFNADGSANGEPFDIYLDNIYFYKEAGSGGGGNTSGDYIYATSETVTISSIIDNWGSGTTIVSDYSGDATYNPSIQLISGTNWGDVSALAFTQMETGILANYSTLEFKIKTTDYTTVKVKVPEVELTFPLSDGTILENGWVQMSIPLSNFSNVVAAANQFAIFEFGAGTMLITDVMLSGEGSGGSGGTGSGDCPAPPAGELLSNGDFEAGDSCWQLFSGTSISTTVSNGGSNSAQLQGSTGVAVGLKQERFAAGNVLPNTSYTVTFDIIASGDFGDGGVFKAFVFSEGADGGTVGATQHILTDNTTSLSTNWETKTYTFTTPANSNQVEGGLSFLIEIVNSSVKLNVDNVVVKITP
jgi:hypothetical protein